MTREEDTLTTNPAEMEALIVRVRESGMADTDRRLLEQLLRLLLRISIVLQNKKVYIERLQRMIFGPGSEKQKPGPPDGETPAGPRAPASPAGKETRTDAASGETEAAEPTADSPTATAETTETEKKPGRGKNKGQHPASAYTGADVVFCPQTANPGDACPFPHCQGHLQANSELQVFIQMKGHPPITATRYDQETLRCSDCGKRSVAPLPPGVEPVKWHPTADAAITLSKYHWFLPLNRLEGAQLVYGVPLSASTQWERIQEVAKHLQPVFRLLRQYGANGEVIYADDTTMKIRELLRENKSLPPKSRTGMQTTGMVVECGGQKIVLYATGRRHAGENVDRLLTRRSLLDSLPIYMADALAANDKVSAEVIRAGCLAHGRRPFVDLTKSWPTEAAFVLDLIGKVYEHDAKTKEMTPEERLAHHQEYSAPVMEKLKTWIDAQLAEKLVEPNGPLGKALKYLQTHWSSLTRFLSVANCPLDNNIAERMLRRIALLRKNSLFYKTQHGADVADIILTIIGSCTLAGVNVWNYLVDVVTNAQDVWRDPTRWLPWNYGRAAPGLGLAAVA